MHHRESAREGHTHTRTDQQSEDKHVRLCLSKRALIRAHVRVRSCGSRLIRVREIDAGRREQVCSCLLFSFRPCSPRAPCLTCMSPKSWIVIAALQCFDRKSIHSWATAKSRMVSCLNNGRLMSRALRASCGTQRKRQCPYPFTLQNLSGVDERTRVPGSGSRPP